MKHVFRTFKRFFGDVLGTRRYLRYRERTDRGRRLAGQFLTFATLALGGYYLVWHWLRINWDCWYLSFPFFFAESIGLVLFCFFAFNAWFLRYHAPEGISADRTFSIDVFITAAGETVEMVAETVEAALHIDYPDKRVYILDDTVEKLYQELAERAGCGYFARPEHKDAKAGNLNYAFDQTHGDLILTLDADQVPVPQIIKRLVGYFRIPTIAFVQSKQDFLVPAGDPFGNRDRIFYNVMQSGKDSDNAAFSCGSGVIYRRAALEEIGGFSTWNLVEDVHSSMLMQDLGWRSIYYNYPLSRGTAPADIYGVYRQRRQWAADSLRILFWDNPFLRSGLTFKQKLQYFYLGVVYLVSAFVMPVFFLMPLLSLFTKTYILVAPVQQYVLHRSPYFIAMTLAYGMLNYRTLYMRAFQVWTGLFPVFIHATWIALRHRKTKPAYRVNVKSPAMTHARNPWLAVAPQLSIIALGPVAILYAFLTGAMPADFYLLNVIWILWSMWALSRVCVAAVRPKRWPGEEESEQEKTRSFYANTKELIGVVALTAVITLFFATVSPGRMDQLLNRARLGLLQSGNVERSVPRAASPIAGKERPAADKNMKEAAAKPEPPPSKSAASEPWVVQVASLRMPKGATALQQKLEAAGFSVCLTPTDSAGLSLIRVAAGFFADREAALKASSQIQETGLIPGVTPWVRFATAAEKGARPTR